MRNSTKLHRGRKCPELADSTSCRYHNCCQNYSSGSYPAGIGRKSARWLRSLIRKCTHHRGWERNTSCTLKDCRVCMYRCGKENTPNHRPHSCLPPGRTDSWGDCSQRHTGCQRQCSSTCIVSTGLPRNTIDSGKRCR
jgi:hypothetical protein